MVKPWEFGSDPISAVHVDHENVPNLLSNVDVGKTKNTSKEGAVDTNCDIHQESVTKRDETIWCDISQEKGAVESTPSVGKTYDFFQSLGIEISGLSSTHLV